MAAVTQNGFNFHQAACQRYLARLAVVAVPQRYVDIGTNLALKFSHSFGQRDALRGLSLDLNNLIATDDSRLVSWRANQRANDGDPTILN